MRRTSLLIAALSLAGFTFGCSQRVLKQAQKYELQGNNSAALLAYQEALSRTPNTDVSRRSEVLMHIGECLYRLDRMSEAFATFQGALETDPTNDLAHLRVGELFLLAGAPDRAREQAMTVLTRNHRDNEALSLLGAAWAAADNVAMAKQAYEQVLQSDPRRVTVAVALADLYNREDNTSKAREILKRATRTRPDSSLPWLAMARLEEQEGVANAAEDAYRHAVAAEDTPETNLRLAQFLQREARIAEAEQVLRRVDAQNRNSTYLGDFQLASGRAGDALDQYHLALSPPLVIPRNFWDRLTRRRPVPPRTSNRGEVAARIIEGEISAAAAAGGREHSSALNVIRRDIEAYRSSLDPATTAILQAEVSLADNNPVLARVYATNSTELAPNSASAHYIAGLVSAAEGNDDAAQTEWQTALDNDAHFTPARLAIAEKALQASNLDAADEQVREVVREDPGNVHALIVFAYVLLQQGRAPSAAVVAHRAAALDPSSLEPFLLLGDISRSMGRAAEALLNYERVVVTHPESEEGIEGMLAIYRQRRVSFAGIQKMEKVAAASPQSGTLLEIAGRLYADHGWYREAIRALSRAVEIDPRRATAARALAQLQLSTGDVSNASALAARVGGNSETLLAAYQDQQNGNWQQAASGYERAVREGDLSGVAANNLAWLYAEHVSQLDRALELAGDAAKLSPNNPTVLDTLGFVLLKRREYSSAVKVLETAARLNNLVPSPDRDLSNQIRKHLSDAYFSAGQTEAAAQIAQRFSPRP
jgi:tetratricopeptide (TPR) repeat protein